MPVTWQRIPISLVRGLDTKSDDKQSVPGSLVTLENGVFGSPGKISKRHGLTSWATTVEGTGSIASGVALATYGNETLLFTGERVFSRLANAKWIERGSATSVQARTDQVLRTSYEQTNPTVAYESGFELYAWEDQRAVLLDLAGLNNAVAGVRCSVVDAESRAVILNDALVHEQATAPQCFAFSGSLYVAYLRGPLPNTSITSCSLYARRVDPSNPSTLGPELTLATDVAQSTPPINAGFLRVFSALRTYAPVPVGSRLNVVYPYRVSASRAGLKVAQFASSSLTALTSSVLGSAEPRVNLAAWSDPSSHVWYAYTSGSFTGSWTANHPVRAGVFSSSNLQTVMTDAAILTASFGARISNVAGVCVTGSVSTLYLELSGSAPVSASSDVLTRVAALSFGPSQPAVTSSFMRSVGLASVPWAHGNSHYVWLVHASTEQPTYFAASADGTIVAKANPSLGGGLRGCTTVVKGTTADTVLVDACRGGQLSNVATTASGTYRFANQRRGSVLSEGGKLFTLAGVASTELAFNASSSFRYATFGDQLLTVGGVVSSYDRLSFAEHGFHVYPEQLSGSLGTRGGMSGSYQYVATYEWVDNNGNVHRSKPSLPFEVVTSMTASVTMSVPTLRLTAKEQRSSAQVCLYRTEHLGTTFYKVTSPTSPTYNTGSADTVTIVDTLSDDELISRELLYTTGGELENDPIPSCTLMATHQNRVWLAGLEDPNELRYSKLFTVGKPAGFSDYLVVNVDPFGGDITAIESLDDKLIVFKESAIHVVYGQGFDNLGGGQNFAQSLITSDVGCVGQNSVAVTDKGVFFKSAKGIYLLDRSLQVSYVGAPVEGWNGQPVTSATLVADANQVRFTLEGGTCLVYDYAAGQWSTFTNHAAADAAVLNGRYAVLRSDGRVSVEDPDSYDDDGSEVKLRLVTSWLSFAGVQGFQRVRRMQLLGEQIGAHSLLVKVGYDFNPTYADEATIAASTVATDPAYSSEGSLYQFTTHLSRQKCTALRVSIEDVQSSNFNEGCSLSNVAFEVGLKRGANKLRHGRHSGTS